MKNRFLGTATLFRLVIAPFFGIVFLLIIYLQISARVISIFGGVSQGGQNSVITLNKGARDGLQNGHVLALYRKGEVVKSKGEEYTLPDERYGLVFIFRVFNKVSYGLVMQTKLPVQLLDRADTP